MTRILLVCVALLVVSLVECLEPVNVIFRYKGNAVLDCSSAEGSEVKFYRKFSNEIGEETEEEITPYNDKRTGKEKAVLAEKTLTLNDLRNYEIAPDYYCKSTSSDEKLEFVKQIQPFLMHPEKQSQTITEGGVVEFACDLLYGQDDSITWKWVRNDTEIVSDDKITITSSKNSTVLKISPVDVSQKGVISCVVSNTYGEHKNEFTLRVKDTMAALWPFLGICAEVLILCVIILVYEKKCVKKSKSDSDNEQAENLMGKEALGSVTKRNAK